MISQSRRAGRASSPTAGRNPAVIAPGQDRLREGTRPGAGSSNRDLSGRHRRSLRPLSSCAAGEAGAACGTAPGTGTRVLHAEIFFSRAREGQGQRSSPARRRRGRDPGPQAVPCPGGSTQLDSRLRFVAPVRRGQAPPLPAYQRTGPGISCLGTMKLPTPPPRLNPRAAVSDPDPVTAPGRAANVPGVTRTAPGPRAKGCRAARSRPEPLPSQPRLADPEPGRPSRIRVEPAGEGDIS